MELFEQDLARVDQAKAYQLGESLLLRVVGELPTPCHTAFLQQSLLTIEPPTFIAGQSIRPGVFCAQLMTPYEHHDIFHVGVTRESVSVHHAGGELTVEVEDLRAEDDRAVSFGPSVAGSALSPDGQAEAVGYSRDFDFGEAFRDAIDKLPQQSPQIPDWLSTYTVVSIQAEIGGIAGFNRLAVKVRG